MTDPIRLRPLASTDSLDAVTATHHRAYARLGAMGLNCTAVDQNVEMTRRRVASGHCIVAEDGAGIVGTITVNEGFDPNATPWARATPWFYRRDVLATLDGRVVSTVTVTVTVTHDEQTFLARSIFGFDTNACIADIDEVWATVEPAPAWRNAAAIGKYVRD